MNKIKTINLILTIIGLASLIYCIMEEIDGIGRFACILFGTILILIGNFRKNNK